MDGTRGQIYNAAARMSGVMAALGQVRYTMDCAIQDWQNELRHADDEASTRTFASRDAAARQVQVRRPHRPATGHRSAQRTAARPPLAHGLRRRRRRLGATGHRPGARRARHRWASSIFDDGNRRGAPPPQRGPPPDSWQASRRPRGGGGAGAGWREPEGRGREEARPLSAGPAPGGGGFGMEMAPRGDPKANEW